MKSKSVLILNGTVLDPNLHFEKRKDVLIEDGKITAVEDPGVIPRERAQEIIDATDAWIMPGFVDLHVHLREPGLEYKETIATGTAAAVAGGFSGVACMANTYPVNDSPYVTAFIREKAKQTARCHVHIVGAVTKGLKGEELAEIGGMVDEGIVAISDDGMPVMNSYLMRKAMDYAKAFSIPVISHAEDLNLVGQGAMNESALSNELGLRGIPAAAEEIMVAREIALCRLTRTPIHIQHISTEVGLMHVRRAKEAGLPVTAEVSPHHLVLTEEEVRGYDTHFKMSPPLRTERDLEALQLGLKEGVIDVIATDHAPHGIVDKAVEFSEASNGVIGLQTALPITLKLVHEGKVSARTWIRSFTDGPRRLLKLGGGGIRPGQPADLTLIRPNEEWTFLPDQNLSKSHNSPFLGWKLRGKVLATLVDGDIKYLSK
jgi:dihydroorotase